MPPAAACVAARHASCGQQNHRRGATRGTIRRTCVCRFRFVIRPRSILRVVMIVVFPGRSRRGAGPRAAAGRGERSDHAGPAPRPTTAHGDGRLRTDHTTRTIPLPETCAPSPASANAISAVHTKLTARPRADLNAPTARRDCHCAFRVYRFRPAAAPQAAVRDRDRSGDGSAGHVQCRAATPGEGSGVCHPCARVFIWNDSSAPEAE